MSNFNNYFNPFRGLSHEELVESYVYYSAIGDDTEAIELVGEAFDEDTYIDLTPFQISTRDYQ